MTNKTGLAGKVALVTGGSRGIGAAIARRLARDGAAVAVTYNASPEKADEVVREIEAAGGRALAVRADSADVGAVRTAVTTTVETFGRLDVLVNNAGILVPGTVDQYAVDDFDRMVAVNVRAVFVAVQEAARHLKQGGRVINIGSMVADRTGFPGSSVYGMTKAAVAALTRGLAIDLAPHGITVNNVQPGPTETDMNPKDSPHHNILIQALPVKRLGRADEIAGMVSYLASPEAAFVTGASLTIDGGLTA
ncbi:MAG TPA: 3-oxoacyl-ACP reductase family protein [Gemmatimonadales bacterium]|jgi:3-oxoacyl-[acyl-carrier protein] reductase|nr:3-oxoacyl-ACP reductase family protein [Gemmatimonadales bacterium]